MGKFSLAFCAAREEDADKRFSSADGGKLILSPGKCVCAEGETVNWADQVNERGGVLVIVAFRPEYRVYGWCCRQKTF